jgi:GT2 family glycosyltransferase
VKLGPHIGVVTITFNSEQVLSEFLACTFQQTHRNFTLYVVDNASKDNTLALLEGCKDKRLKILAQPVNLGVAEGNNQGIRAALADGCDTVLLLNNDTEFGNNMFACLHAGLEAHNCDMTTGKMLYFDPPDLIWCAGGYFDEKRYYGAFHIGMDVKDIGQFNRAQRVTYAPTCCLMVRRSVFDAVGFMDSRYFVYTDDVDFLYRCLIHGLTLWYLPNAILFHKVSSLTGGSESPFAIRYMTRNRVYFLRKHLPGYQVFLWLVHFMAYTAPKRLLSGTDSVRTYRLRCASILEGLRMSHD